MNKTISRVQISKVLRITAGRFHCWVDSSIGTIRKPNNTIPDFLWDSFYNKEIKVGTISAKEIKIDKIKPSDQEPKLKWYKRAWNWIKKKLGLTPSTKH